MLYQRIANQKTYVFQAKLCLSENTYAVKLKKVEMRCDW